MKLLMSNVSDKDVSGTQKKTTSEWKEKKAARGATFGSEVAR